MYPYLSQFLASELEILSYCLEAQLADSLEIILTKVARQEIEPKEAWLEIGQILQLENSDQKANSGNDSKLSSDSLENQAQTLVKSKTSKKSRVTSANSGNDLSTGEKSDSLKTSKSKLALKTTETSQIQVENLTKNIELKTETNFSLDLETSESAHLATASLRAPVGYHLPNAMKTMEQKHGALLVKSGGHPGAAGFSAQVDFLDQIKEKLSLEIAAQNTVQTEKKSYVNASFKTKIPKFLDKKALQKNLIWLNLSDLSLQFLRDVCQLEPFGQDFTMPNFMLAVPLINSKLQGKRYFNEFALNRQRKLGPLYFWLGKEQKHIKIEINDLKITVFSIPTFLKDKLNNPQEETINLWLECRVAQNTWQEKTTLELLSQEIWLE